MHSKEEPSEKNEKFEVVEELEPIEAKPPEKNNEKKEHPVEKAVEKISKKKIPKAETSSSESENEVEVVKVKKSKKKPKKKVIYISESDSDSEPEIVYRQKSSKRREYKEPEQPPVQVPSRPSYGTHLVNLMRNGYTF